MFDELSVCRFWAPELGGQLSPTNFSLSLAVRLLDTKYFKAQDRVSQIPGHHGVKRDLDPDASM